MIPPKARILILTRSGGLKTNLLEMEEYDIVIVENEVGDYKVLKNVWADTLVTVSQPGVENILSSLGVRSAT